MTRLSEHDWLQHGLKTLSESGYVGLKADLMAKALGVSRGSFYWHFKNLAAFQSRLLEHWQEATTERVIKDIEGSRDSDRALEDLMNRALSESAFGRTDQAIRLWAQYDPKAAHRLLTVDKMRLAYLTKLLEGSGLSKQVAESRARFIYAASLGNAQLPDDSWSEFTVDQIGQLADLMKQ